MVKSFLQWLEINSKNLDSIGIESKIAVKSDYSVGIDFKTKKAIARITVWDEGFMDLEVLKPNTTLTLLWQHLQFNIPPQFDYLLEKFFKVLLEGKNIDEFSKDNSFDWQVND